MSLQEGWSGMCKASERRVVGIVLHASVAIANIAQ